MGHGDITALLKFQVLPGFIDKKEVTQIWASRDWGRVRNTRKGRGTLLMPQGVMIQ